MFGYTNPSRKELQRQLGVRQKAFLDEYETLTTKHRLRLVAVINRQPSADVAMLDVQEWTPPPKVDDLYPPKPQTNESA